MMKNGEGIDVEIRFGKETYWGYPRFEYRNESGKWLEIKWIVSLGRSR